MSDIENGHNRQLLFKFLAFCCLLASAYHLYGVFDSTMRVGYPLQRHLVFSGLNIALAYFLIVRTWYFVPFLLALTVQQFVGHGQSLINTWVVSNTLSIIDLGAIVFMLLLVPIYVVDLVNADKRVQNE